MAAANQSPYLGQEIDLLSARMQTMQITSVTKDTLAKIIQDGSRAYMNKNAEDCSKSGIVLEDIQIVTAQILVDGLDSVLDKQDKIRTTTALMFPDGLDDEINEGELTNSIKIMESTIPNLELDKELSSVIKQSQVSVASTNLLRDVFDAHNVPVPFTKKFLTGLDTKEIKLVSSKVAEVIPEFFDEFVAVDGTNRHSKSGKATKRDCVDGLYRVAQCHNILNTK